MRLLLVLLMLSLAIPCYASEKEIWQEVFAPSKLAQQGDYEGAIKGFKDVCVKYPDTKYEVSAMFNLVNIYDKTGQLDKIMPLLDDMIKRYSDGPLDFDAGTARILRDTYVPVILEYEGKTDEAIIAYKKLKVNYFHDEWLMVWIDTAIRALKSDKAEAYKLYEGMDSIGGLPFDEWRKRGMERSK